MYFKLSIGQGVMTICETLLKHSGRLRRAELASAGPLSMRSTLETCILEG